MVADITAIPLTNIINNSIKKYAFPQAWKTGRISPIPKVENLTEEAHFRPVSVLPVWSKVGEKLVTIEVTKHIESNCLLTNTVP